MVGRALSPGRLALLLLALGCGDDANPDCPPTPNAGRCATDADCCAAPPCETRCVGSETDGTLALACAAPPGPGEGGDACATSADCANGLCLVAGRCAAPCRSSDDCPTEERCQRGWIAGGGHRATVCVPRSSVPPIAQGTDEDTRELVLDAAPVGAHHLLSPRCGVRPWLLTLDGPEGNLFDRDALAPGAPPPINPVFAAYPGPITVALPSGLGGVDADAEHVATFEAPATFHRQVFAPSTGATLDVDLFLVGVAEPPASTFEPLQALLESAGLSLGEVRVRAVNGAAADALAIIESDRGELPELADLFALGAGLPPSVPIFAVRQLDLFLALSGGIPAGLPAPGTETAGIVVGAELAGSALGTVIAHEVGHTLGLFHPTEFDGTVYEPLDDTPVCPLEADTDGDGILSAGECADRGATNPLFWALDRVGTTLTPDQAAIIRRSPVLR